MHNITIQDFQNVIICAGTVIKAETFMGARKPAYKVWVDFGEYGIKKTSVQITVHYKTDELIGKQVLGCINLGTRQIGDFMSEFLMLGCPDAQGAIQLVRPDGLVPNGVRLM